MTLPPRWKVRREVDRIRVKTSLFVGRWLYDPLRKPIYDLTSHWRQRITVGSLPMTDRVAVFVIYQPNGFPASLLMTLDHLRENRFSVVLVSNGPLRPEDRTKLARRSALVLERPNVGYDFGAYRDGIRHLWALKQDLSLLVLMNDSTWFPLRRDDDSLARMEALGADLAGHIYKIEDEAARNRDHVESHLLMISGDLTKSTAFKQYWQNYRMSDHRAPTIEKGEKGFSQMVIHSGWHTSTLLGRDWLLSTLSRLDDQEIRQVLDHTIDSFKGRQKDASSVRRAAEDGSPWRNAYVSWVEASLFNSLTFMISATFIMPAVVYGGMGFAKKASDIRFHLARQELLELETNGLILPLDDVVRKEIEEAVRSWNPPRGQEHLPRRRTSVTARTASERLSS